MRLRLRRDVNKAKAEAVEKIEAMLAPPPSERPQEYTTKYLAAIVGNASLFADEAAARGMEPEELMRLSRAKAEEHAAETMRLAAIRVSAIRDIESCATAAEVDSVLERVSGYK